MNAKQIIALVKASAEADAEPSGSCLPPEQLAAYQDGKLHDQQRGVAEAHLAACDRCLGQLAAMSRSATAQEAETGVPASLIARAEALFTPPARGTAPTRWRWAVPLAAAAVLFLALTQMLDPSGGLNDEPASPPTPQTRYAGREPLQPRLLTPAEDSVVRPADQVFQWTEVPGTLFYEVRLISFDGDLLLRQRVDGTHWLIPKRLRLDPGEEYFVRVDAYLSDAKYLSSEHRMFRVDRGQ